MERPFTHEITYTNAGRIPVSDVAASLLANEQLVREAAYLLEALFSDLKVDHVEVNFRSATTSSPLKEIMAGAIFLAFQEDLTKQVPALIERVIGIDVPSDLEALVTVLVLVIAVYGIAKAIEIFGSKKAAEDGEAPSIQGNFNTVLNVGGDIIGVEPERIAEALERRYQGRRGRTLARRALEFIRPAKREDGASITGGGLEIEAGTISVAPSALDIEMSEEDEIHEPYMAQAVEIHATDIDSNNTGWAGHLPGLWDHRLKMRLYPTIKTEELFGRRHVVADVLLVSKRDAAGDYVPYLFHLMQLHEG